MTLFYCAKLSLVWFVKYDCDFQCTVYRNQSFPSKESDIEDLTEYIFRLLSELKYNQNSQTLIKFKRSWKSINHSSTKLHYTETAETAWHQVAAKHTTEWDYFKGRDGRNKESTRINQTPF